jgi:RNA polymerase sigma factor (sigma-70 family)
MGRKRQEQSESVTRVDERAIAELFSQMRPRIMRYLEWKFRSTLRPGEAEDVVQEGFLRAWNLRDRFDARRGSLEGWFFRICLNVARDWRSAGWQKQRAEERGAAAAELTQVAIAESLSAARGASSADPFVKRLHQIVREALASLSERDQSILRADADSRAGRLPDAVHAAELRVSTATAKKVHQRAYEHLKAALEIRGVTLDSHGAILIQFSMPRERPPAEKNERFPK